MVTGSCPAIGDAIKKLAKPSRLRNSRPFAGLI